jgi:hypothetical protein
MSEIRLPLSEVLGYISAEIHQAHERANLQQNAVMKFAECELDFAIETEKKAEGGVHVWVLQLGAGAKKTEANTMKIKYTAVGEPMVAVIEGSGGAVVPAPVRDSQIVK